jgi:hypothetical protein
MIAAWSTFPFAIIREPAIREKWPLLHMGLAGADRTETTLRPDDF